MLLSLQLPSLSTQFLTSHTYVYVSRPYRLEADVGASLTPTDDKILVDMGSTREGKTAEEREEYVAGLKQAINDMRRDKVKDFDTVITEITAYRRRFLQDPTRLLPL